MLCLWDIPFVLSPVPERTGACGEEGSRNEHDSGSHMWLLPTPVQAWLGASPCVMSCQIPALRLAG